MTRRYVFSLRGSYNLHYDGAQGPEVIKLFFVLNSAEHEICPANKSQITNNCNFFLLLNIAEHENFSANKYENANDRWHFHIYQQRNFHAQLS